MYVLPKALESAWRTARGRGWAPPTRGVGEVMLTAAGMGMVMVSGFAISRDIGEAGGEKDGVG